MIKALLAGICVATLSIGAASAEPVDGEATYDLLFRNGTLEGIDRATSLVYHRDVVSVLKPASAERDTGDIALSFRDDGEGLARLEFRQNERKRTIGMFPASVGNPMIMYFYESVIRDMAEAAGGSPFYIRNRVKEALVQPAEVEPGEAVIDGQKVATRTIRLHPFVEDPNRERMQGFGSLELAVTMSDDVPGWYVSLVATAEEGTKTVYRSEMVFNRLEGGE